MRKTTLISQIAKRYGQALFEAVLESPKGKKHALQEALKNAQSILNFLNRDVLRFLENPVCPEADKSEVLQLLVKASGIEDSVIFKSFLSLILKANRTFALDDSLKRFINQSEEYLGIAHGTIISALPLSEKEAVEVQESIGKFLKKDVTLMRELDPSLLSGFIIRVNGFSVDASLKSELNEMRNLLN